jgi:cobalt-precorrin-5B (C1)-methyltransferase
MSFAYYTQVGKKLLRRGFTTGSCAALAAKAAAQLLFSGRRTAEVEIMTPLGIPVKVPVVEAVLTDNAACCAVQKDAGDDPDVTDGVLVYAKVCKTARPGILIKGGCGIGRVERPGLDQPIGAAAINRVPRQMIGQEVQAVCARFAHRGGVEVTISIPQGAELARRTFNARLGIAGGISVLGTSGIVEPRSTQAFLDCIALELRTLAVAGNRGVILTPGNYGEAFIAANVQLAAARVPTVKCSNYIGAALDFAVAGGFKRILLVGHLGKFIKLAGGIMNTHSKVADCRMELFAAHAALAGAGKEVVARLMQATATEACLPILEAGGLKAAVFSSLLQNIAAHLMHRAGPEVVSGAVLFSNEHGLLGQTAAAAELIASFQQATYQ